MIQWWQVLLLTLYAGYQILDELQIYSSLSAPVAAGLISGLIMGDVGSGLKIGAAMQLTVLGVGTFGGASKIDANSGTVLATAFSVAAHMDPEQAITTIAVPVAAIMTFLDILARFTNTFFAHRIDKEVEKQNYGAIQRYFLAGALPWSLSRMIPVALATAFGSGLVTKLTDLLNGPWKWLGDGLSVAGAVLPAVGFSILLRYLPVKKHIAYLLLGFTITSLLTTVFGSIQGIGGTVGSLIAGVTLNKGAEVAPLGTYNGLSMLAVAIIALGFAIIAYNNDIRKPAPAAGAANNSSNEGEIEDDEL